MLITIKEISKQFDEHEVYHKFSLTIDEGHKIAVVGNNGVGKSTLLKMIGGIIDPDSGEIIFAKGKSVAYLPQEIPLGDHRTAKEYIQASVDGPFVDHLVFALFDGLGLSHEMYEKNLQEMSGGQRTKVLLTRFLLEKADVLMLDEPTNNLDMHSLIWLETFLKESKKAMMIISHDLYFLNNVANRVLEIKASDDFEVSRGSYGDYLERQKKEFERKMAVYKQYTRKVRELEGRVEDIQAKNEKIEKYEAKDNDKSSAGYNKDRATAALHDASKVLKVIDRLGEVEKPYEEEPFVIEIHPKNTESDLKIEAKDMVAGYTEGKKATLEVGTLTTELNLGDRLCFMGGNGEGKTTVLKTLIGQLPALKGSVHASEGIIIGDLLQQQERADRSKTALEFFMSEAKAGKEKGMHMMKKYGMSENIFNHSIAGLSSGTRARLLLAVFATLGVNVLVLDEPTNHLDVDAVQALNDMLVSYAGIVVLVSHNRWFLERVQVKEYYEVQNGKIERIQNLEKYLEEAKKKAEYMVRRLKRIVQI